MQYLYNCFILLIPIFIWNVLFTKSLPKNYTLKISDKLEVFENIFRILAFVIPLVMKISFETNIQKIGLGIYILGIIIYFISWLMQIYLVNSLWSRSIYGFLAPAYTTFIWFLGIALIGKQSYFNLPYLSIIYLIVAILFVAFHTLHTYNVFKHSKL